MGRINVIILVENFWWRFQWRFNVNHCFLFCLPFFQCFKATIISGACWRRFQWRFWYILLPHCQHNDPFAKNFSTISTVVWLCWVQLSCLDFYGRWSIKPVINASLMSLHQYFVSVFCLWRRVVVFRVLHRVRSIAMCYMCRVVKNVTN